MKKSSQYTFLLGVICLIGFTGCCNNNGICDEGETPDNCIADFDKDSDGFYDEFNNCGGDDCDDGNPDVNPGKIESDFIGNCDNGLDDDCDGFTDKNDPDCVGECTDEGNFFDGIDNDCDGLVDEGVDINIDYFGSRAHNKFGEIYYQIPLFTQEDADCFLIKENSIGYDYNNCPNLTLLDTMTYVRFKEVDPVLTHLYILEEGVPVENCDECVHIYSGEDFSIFRIPHFSEYLVAGPPPTAPGGPSVCDYSAPGCKVGDGQVFTPWRYDSVNDCSFRLCGFCEDIVNCGDYDPKTCECQNCPDCYQGSRRTSNPYDCGCQDCQDKSESYPWYQCDTYITDSCTCETCDDSLCEFPKVMGEPSFCKCSCGIPECNEDLCQIPNPENKKPGSQTCDCIDKCEKRGKICAGSSCPGQCCDHGKTCTHPGIGCVGPEDLYYICCDKEINSCTPGAYNPDDGLPPCFDGTASGPFGTYEEAQMECDECITICPTEEYSKVCPPGTTDPDDLKACCSPDAACRDGSDGNGWCTNECGDCDAGEICCDDNECCSPENCINGECTECKTCADYAWQCGQFNDNCGGTVTCTCPQPFYCEDGECTSDPDCKSCLDFSAECGTFYDDQCMKVIRCDCAEDYYCQLGDGIVPNRCKEIDEPCYDPSKWCEVSQQCCAPHQERVGGEQGDPYCGCRDTSCGSGNWIADPEDGCYMMSDTDGKGVPCCCRGIGDIVPGVCRGGRCDFINC
ncbi:hypothetical protein ACFLZX_00665 [Nanoarchaeota archaeon]